MTWQKAEQHYRQSDINTIRINDLEIAVSNLQVRQRNVWLTNRLLDDEIRALQTTNANLAWWVKRLQTHH